MRLTDLLQPDCLKVPLVAAEKQAAIFELADLLAQKTGVPDAAALREAIWHREQTRTTGIGHGIAIPHGKCAGIQRLSMAIGRPAEPIAFGSIDGQPVDLIFLIASPPDQTGPHIQALARISRLLTDESFRDAIRDAPDAATLYEMILRQEEATG